MPGRDCIDELQEDYKQKKAVIVKRLLEFKEVFRRGDQAIFEELCFCILTAGSSARMGLYSLAVMRDILHTGSLKDLQKRAHLNRIRFWRLRPSYIVQTRRYLNDACGMKLRDLLESFGDADERRDFFARNKSIKGLGYKESSHFLRNIGYSGYTILDKHIVNSLRELGVINSKLRPTTRAGYLKIEQHLIKFAQEIKIDVDHLDLLLWSRKTGEILK